MTKKKMTRAEEVEFYAKPENQEPQGPGRRRSKLTEMVPVSNAGAVGATERRLSQRSNALAGGGRVGGGC